VSVAGRVIVDWRERTTIDPASLVGKPVVRGRRLAVEFVLDLITGGWRFDEIIANYPGLTVEIRACVAYAKDIVGGSPLQAVFVERQWGEREVVAEADAPRIDKFPLL
jgi:uncharacterized protein (DUF433 family)